MKSVIALIAVFAAWSVHAEMIIAQCEDLQGPRVDYQKDYGTGDHVLKEGRDSYGPRTYIWDSDKPKVLQELKSGRVVDLQRPGEVDVELLTVANHTGSAIIAVELTPSGVFTHTLWPTRGFFLLTRTSAQSTGAVGALYYAKCSVTKRG